MIFLKQVSPSKISTMSKFMNMQNYIDYQINVDEATLLNVSVILGLYFYNIINSLFKRDGYSYKDNAVVFRI